MRIVRGRWAGRDLTSPGPRVRPTAEAVRDRWLELLKDDLPDARVLDLFAGSGALGLEAVSRGARFVDFVENGAASLHALKANVAKFRLGKRARIYRQDAIPFVERLEAGVYDIAFADPPYRSAKGDRVLARWREVPFARVFTIEHDAEHPLPTRRGRRYDFGATRVTIYRAPPEGTNR